MTAPPTLGRVKAAVRDLSALGSGFRAGLRGFRAAWRDTVALARNRQLIVATPPGPDAVLLTRVRITGETETCVLRAWLERTLPGEVEATAARHFAYVTSATRGWPAVLGVIRLAPRIAALGGAIAGVQELVRSLSGQGAASLLHAFVRGASLAWPLYAGLALLVVGAITRPILRSWLRTQIRRVPLRIPTSP